MKTTVKSKNLIEELQEEIDRVQKLCTEYRSVPGGAGNLAAIFMESSIAFAKRYIGEGDTIGMLKSLKELREYNN